jgi:hypothetical protein
MREKRLAVSHGHKEQRIVGRAKEVETTWSEGTYKLFFVLFSS